MKKLLTVLLFCASVAQAGRVEVQYFKNAVMGKNKNLATAILGGLDNKDQASADTWYKQQGEPLGKLAAHASGFDWASEAPNAKTAGEKLIYIGKKLVPEAIKAVGNDKDAIDQFKADVKKA